jgi:hypothetical protein
MYLLTFLGSYATRYTVGMSESSLSKIQFRDGKVESFGVYISKIDAYAEFMCMEDALDPV